MPFYKVSKVKELDIKSKIRSFNALLNCHRKDLEDSKKHHEILEQNRKAKQANHPIGNKVLKKWNGLKNRLKNFEKEAAGRSKNSL